MVNRKLIRPSMSDFSSSMSKFQAQGRKRVPPEQTHAENFYYVKQMNNKTPMVIRLTNGEELHGYIEWYDRDCLKVNREESPNLVVYKSAILYLFKEDELASESGEEQLSSRKRMRRRREGAAADQEAESGLPAPGNE